MSSSTQSALCARTHQFNELTTIILGAGYEHRLIQGMSNLGDGSNSIEWWLGDSMYTYLQDATPLTAGGRLISPEEIDSSLAEALNLDPSSGFYDGDDTNIKSAQELELKNSGHEEMIGDWIRWGIHKSTPNTFVNPAEYDKLFVSYGSNKTNPEKYRDTLATTRAQLATEIKELCYSSGHRYSFDKMLCVALNKCHKPLDIGKWLKTQFYCGFFSTTGIMSISFIQNDKHKVMIINYDGESG